MPTDVYLMYFPTGSSWEWNAFNATSCPDPHGFPDHIYRKYEVSFDDEMKVFRRLCDVRDVLREREFVPEPGNLDGIYPSLDELLAENFEYEK